MFILRVILLLSLVSCALVPTVEINDIEYCVRQKGTNFCRDYYQAPYDACSVYDDDPYCKVRQW